MFYVNNEYNGSISVGGAASVLPSGRDTVLPTPFFDVQQKAREIRARYDAAVTSPENERHWRMADPFSPDAALNPVVRKKIRERARYEIANNTYAKGLILTFAGDIVGTGPRIQLFGAPSTRWENRIEAAFIEWADETGLAEKLTTLAQAKTGDGEAFGIMVFNPKLESPVKFEIVPVECDRICASFEMISRPNNIDGVIIDSLGNPVAYECMESHPGDTNTATLTQWDRIDARWVVHWFRKDRPEQHRGVSEIAPALPLFAQLRRYTLATIAAAETASDYAAILYTDNPATQTAVKAVPFEMVDIAKRTMTVLPDGWKMGQFSPEQPVTTYAEFKREVLGEIARCLQVPINVISGDSSRHNYASGRLDHQTYHRAIRVCQSQCAKVILNKVFREWIKEYTLALGLPAGKFDGLKPGWMFDGFEHVDPQKEANAQALRLASMTTSYAAEYAKQGKDWEVEFEQIAKERQRLKELGLDIAEVPVNQQEREDER